MLFLHTTVGKRNYFTGYGILLHKLPVVAALFTQSNNNEGTMKNSILHTMYRGILQFKLIHENNVNSGSYKCQ